jgi:hypothetical protein
MTTENSPSSRPTIPPSLEQHHGEYKYLEVFWCPISQDSFPPDSASYELNKTGLTRAIHRLQLKSEDSGDIEALDKCDLWKIFVTDGEQLLAHSSLSISGESTPQPKTRQQAGAAGGGSESTPQPEPDQPKQRCLNSVYSLRKAPDSILSLRLFNSALINKSDIRFGLWETNHFRGNNCETQCSASMIKWIPDLVVCHRYLTDEVKISDLADALAAFSEDMGQQAILFQYTNEDSTGPQVIWIYSRESNECVEKAEIRRFQLELLKNPIDRDGRHLGHRLVQDWLQKNEHRTKFISEHFFASKHLKSHPKSDGIGATLIMQDDKLEVTIAGPCEWFFQTLFYAESANDVYSFHDLPKLRVLHLDQTSSPDRQIQILFYSVSSLSQDDIAAVDDELLHRATPSSPLDYPNYSDDDLESLKDSLPCPCGRHFLSHTRQTVVSSRDSSWMNQVIAACPHPQKMKANSWTELHDYRFWKSPCSPLDPTIAASVRLTLGTVPAKEALSAWLSGFFQYPVS